jgi:hypothetical protein
VHNDRLHSTDIAFKPNSSGWGFSQQYASKYDNIFKKKTSSTEGSTASKTSPNKRSTLFDKATSQSDANLASLKAQILALPADQRSQLLDELSRE